MGVCDHSASFWSSGGSQGKLVIFGGRYPSEEGLWKASAQLLVWDVAEGVWSSPIIKPGIVVGKHNEGRYGHFTEIIRSEMVTGSSSAHPSSMMICGGKDAHDQPCTDGRVLSLESMTWIKRVRYQKLQKAKSWIGIVSDKKSGGGNPGEENTIMVLNGEE